MLLNRVETRREGVDSRVAGGSLSRGEGDFAHVPEPAAGEKRFLEPFSGQLSDRGASRRAPVTAEEAPNRRFVMACYGVHSGRAVSVALLAAVAVVATPHVVTAQSVSWYVETVDAAGDVGYCGSLSLDGSGCPHISYSGSTDLRYAYWDASGWHIETVDATAWSGDYTSLALHWTGRPRISYYDLTNGDLRYAYQDASGWHIEFPDSVGDVGRCSSLALSALGRPRISYQDYTNKDLKYARRDASGWHTETVDAAGNVGWGTSLALDASDYPHIGYRDAGDDDLEYAWQDASGWHTETVDWGVGGLDPSLALDASGWPRISYGGNGNLKYAWRDASGWQTEIVDSAVSTGYYSSVALDVSGWPRISYYDYSNYDLKYAYRDASGWHLETVDWAGDVGKFTSLALDSSDRPRISYSDYTNHDLRYACGLSALVVTGTLSNGQLVLDWTGVADAANYWVYGADNLAHFKPGIVSPYQYRLITLSSGTTTWSNSNGICDPAHNWTYLVLAVNATEHAVGLSNRVGEHDFGMTIDK